MIKEEDFLVAVEILDRKIADLNIEITKNQNNLEQKKELENLLEIKKEINKGNAKLIEKIISGSKK